MEKLEAIREGREKVIHRSDDPNFLICFFKDTITTDFGAKKKEISQKSLYNSQISARIFQLLEDKGIHTHFVKMMDERSMLVKPLQMIPIELIIRLVVAGSMARNMGIPEGTKLKKPVIDLNFKSEKLKDPRVNESYIDALDIIPLEESTRWVIAIVDASFNVRPCRIPWEVSPSRLYPVWPWCANPIVFPAVRDGYYVRWHRWSTNVGPTSICARLCGTCIPVGRCSLHKQNENRNQYGGHTLELAHILLSKAFCKARVQWKWPSVLPRRLRFIRSREQSRFARTFFCYWKVTDICGRNGV